MDINFSLYVNDFLKNMKGVVDNDLIDIHVSSFIDAINKNYPYGTPSKELLELTIKIKILSDFGASKNLASRMNDIFDRTFSSERKKLLKGWQSLFKNNIPLNQALAFSRVLDKLDRADASMWEVRRQLQEIFTNKASVQAFVKYATPELREQVALFASVELPQPDQKLEVFNEKLANLIDTLTQVGEMSLIEDLVSIKTDDGYEKATESALKVFRDPSALILLLEHGQPELIQAILPPGSINFAAQDRDGNTFLHHAALKGAAHATTYLLEKVPLDTENHQGKRRLWLLQNPITSA